MAKHTTKTTTESKVIIVMLRRPRKNNPSEQRDDPFWEFGSFGCADCHQKTLLHPKTADNVAGARLAFAQGGPLGTRLVYLSPPVRIIRHRNIREARWTPHDMPFKYAEAPLLIGNTNRTDFPAIKRWLNGVGGSTGTARFASAFRSRSRPLDPNTATEIIRTYAALRADAKREAIASNYVEALPYPPAKIDRYRRRTYAKLLRSAGGKSKTTCCGRRKRRGC